MRANSIQNGEVNLQGPLVSVVTPVYNGEQFLRGCIESLLSQTYTNWDYSIVDNRSNDGTLAIARAFAANDSRISVYTNDTFVPVNANYNNAFRKASANSKYCKVIAADDSLFPECLEKMVALAEAHPSVAIVGAYALAESGVMWQGLPFPTSVIPGREVCRAWLLGGPYIFGTASSQLFRTDVVRARDAFYNETNLHADSEACLEFLQEKDFGFVHQILVYQGTRPDSLTSFSQRMNTYLPYWLYELVKYGPLYLSPDERAARIRELLRGYYSYLGEQAYRGREAAFWNYHREKLNELGYPVRARRVAAAATLHALNKINVRSVSNVVRGTFRRVVRRMRE